MIPEIGKVYKFYDDGKVRVSRQYDATILNIITKEDAKKVMFSTYCNEYTSWEPTTNVYHDEEPVGEMSLYDKWIEESSYKDWIFAEDTDYFIECDIPDYDENRIWFTRTKEGGWFSLDIQSGWQGGILDVTNELTEKLN